MWLLWYSLIAGLVGLCTRAYLQEGLPSWYRLLGTDEQVACAVLAGAFWPATGTAVVALMLAGILYAIVWTAIGVVKLLRRGVHWVWARVSTRTS